MASPGPKPPQGSAPSATAPSLNVYKKVSVIRHSDDSLNYEDVEGNVKSVSIQELGDAIATATPLVTPRPKLDIPVPHINNVTTYGRDVPANYGLPRAYIRYHRPTQEELNDALEYIADNEDESWLKNNTKFGGMSVEKKRSEVDSQQQGKQTGSYSLQRKQQLSLGILETILDILEKATGFEAIITSNQAENLILNKVPQLYHMYPVKARQGVLTTRHVINDVYNYWVQKRSKLKRPLLRRFWPVTSTDDTNPHLVFRPREKEKYKLRKKRQNDMDAYLKMKQLRSDFDNLRVLLELVKRREELNRLHLRVQVDLFEQRLFDIVDTTGTQRHPGVSKDETKRLLDVPIHFDVHAGTRKAKRIRTTGMSSSRVSPSPLTGIGSLGLSPKRDVATGSLSEQARRQNVAGRNHGEPAPLFLHPLRTRETYATNWDGFVPHVTTYSDSHPEPTFRFRHRPRVGRGGRICIDRLPQPVDERIPPVTVFTAGQPLPQSLRAKARLLDLLPRPLDRAAVSRKIEQMSVAAIQEDLEAKRLSAPVPGETDENDGDEVIIRTEDWLETDDQLWGEERFAIGPI